MGSRKSSKQMSVTDKTLAEIPETVLKGEELDKALYDVMNTLWKAYRQSIYENSYTAYNDSFKPLYAKYTDRGVVRFIEGFGMGLVNALNRRVDNNGK